MQTADAEPWVLLSIGTAFVVLRLYARWSKVRFRQFQMDDYLMLGFAADVTLAHTVGAIFHGLTNSYMTDAARASLSPDSVAGFLAALISDVTTDLDLVSIPLSLLWGVQIPLREKVVLFGPFSSSLFVVVAGLITGQEGAISGSQWACRETFVAVVRNLPTPQPLFRTWATKVGLSGSYPLSSMGNCNKKRVAPISHYTGTAWAGDERIVEGTVATLDHNIIVTKNFTVESE
ncbi:hypothetical protein F4801DRAFT_589196 [Xylaria longipes]|nr:hypothetical protein F4801DRAFT_589196 [Xylaria longipes]